MTARTPKPATTRPAARRPGLRVALRSVTGAHRASNQDSAGAGPGFAFVADGVGGHAGGDVASRSVARSLAEALRERDPRTLTDDEVAGVLTAANTELAELAKDPHLTGMATTFTGVFCAADAIRVVHIGDSRAYLLRDGSGTRVTKDDSYVQLLVDSGVLDPAEAWQHPQRNLILQSLAGTAEDSSHLAVLRQEWRAGDRWLLCSDGLTDYVAEDEVIDLLGRDEDVDAIADLLVATALAADARDNITVAVCDVLPGARGAKPRSPRLVGSADPASAEPPADTEALPVTGDAG